METIRRSLYHLKGKRIAKVELFTPEVVAYPLPERFCPLLTGRGILDLHRRGKSLIFQLEGQILLVFRFGMTGKLLLRHSYLLPPHTHVVFSLEDGHFLMWQDVRRFGRLYGGRREEVWERSGLKDLSPEPLEANFTLEFLEAVTRARKRPIKSLLLD